MYNKIVELPTGVVTKISDKLKGRVEVIFEVRRPFDLKI